MDTKQKFKQLQERFELKPADFYFLDLIPLIGMMWADGENQPGELRILYYFLIRRISFLDKEIGMHVVTVDDANDFLDRFCHRKPSTQLLEELMRLFIEADSTSFRESKDSIVNYCLDIAAACATDYPYDLRGRIVDEEKKFLLKLFREFELAPQPSP